MTLDLEQRATEQGAGLDTRRIGAADEMSMLDWFAPVGDAGRHLPGHLLEAGGQSLGVQEIALAVACGALPLSELRRSVEPAHREIEQAQDRFLGGEALEASGEDAGSDCFLDRFLGAGVEPPLDETFDPFAS